MKLRTNAAASATGLALLTVLALSGCGVSQQTAAGGTSTPASVCAGGSDDKAADPTQLTLALVPSGDASKLVETVKPLEDALTQRLGIPVKGCLLYTSDAADEL